MGRARGHSLYGRPNGVRQRQPAPALRPGEGFGRCWLPQWDGRPRTSQLDKAFGAEGRMLLVRIVARLRPSAGSFKDANPRTTPHSRVRTKKKRPRVGGLSRDMLVRMSSRPPFTPEPQKRDDQILVANRIAGEAVVRIVPSNSFDRCNYATWASDRRVHGVFNWCPRSNSRTVNSPRPGRVASPPTPLPPCPAVQG